MENQLDTAPCGYFSISDSGTILSINQTLLNMIGREQDELMGKHIESMMSVTNKVFFHTYFYPYIQLYGHVDEMYFSFRNRDQENVPVLLNGVRQMQKRPTGGGLCRGHYAQTGEHEKDIRIRKPSCRSYIRKHMRRIKSWNVCMRNIKSKNRH